MATMLHMSRAQNPLMIVATNMVMKALCRPSYNHHKTSRTAQTKGFWALPAHTRGMEVGWKGWKGWKAWETSMAPVLPINSAFAPALSIPRCAETGGNPFQKFLSQSKPPISGSPHSLLAPGSSCCLVFFGNWTPEKGDCLYWIRCKHEKDGYPKRKQTPMWKALNCAKS